MYDEQRLSLQWPDIDKNRASGRIYHGNIEMRFDSVIRQYAPSQAPILFSQHPSSQSAQYTIELTDTAASVIDGNNKLSVAAPEHNSGTEVYIDFPNGKSAGTLGYEAKEIIRRITSNHSEIQYAGTFAPHCYVWRLASMYLSAAWSQSNGEVLTTAAYIPEFMEMNSIENFSSALKNCYEEGINPVMVFHEADLSPADIVQLLPILALASIPEPHYRTSVDLPSVATQWPPLQEGQHRGRHHNHHHHHRQKPNSRGDRRQASSSSTDASLYFCGKLPQNVTVPYPTLTKDLIWEAAMLWCKSHGCLDLFMDYIDTIAVLWTSSSAMLNNPMEKTAPIFDTFEIAMVLPKYDTISTLLMPISRPPPKFMEPRAMPSHQIFCRGVNTRLILTLLTRIAVSYGGNGHEEKGKKAKNKIPPSMCAAHRLALEIGYAGSFGPLMNIYPVFMESFYSLDEWWDMQQDQLQEGRAIFPSICRQLALVQ